jgi:hypothetical protein
MAPPPVRSFALLALATLMACPAFAGKPAKPAPKPAAKKANGPAIKALENQIHELREQEKAALKGLSEKYAHIIKSMDPKEIRGQLEEILVLLGQVQIDLGHGDELNYGGNRIRAHESLEKAAHQVEAALHHDTWEERAKAAHDIGAVYVDLEKALVFSAAHPLDGKGIPAVELEKRVAENRRLVDALPRIGLAHNVLMAVDHEVKDYKAEKNILHEKHEAAAKQMKEQYHAKIEQLEEQLKAAKK